jgi:hypothetical protein
MTLRIETSRGDDLLSLIARSPAAIIGLLCKYGKGSFRLIVTRVRAMQSAPLPIAGPKGALCG